MAALEIVLVPALSDNYVYLLHDAGTGATAVVDPGEAPPVEAALAARGWTLTQIVNTHHHHDHTDGNDALKAKYGVPLVGPRAESARIAGMDVMVGDGDNDCGDNSDEDGRWANCHGAPNTTAAPAGTRRQ